MTQLYHSHDQEENTNYHLLLIENCQPKTTKRQVCNEWTCPQSSVFWINLNWELLCYRRSTLKLHWRLLLITWTKKTFSSEKLCGQNQKLCCLATVSSSIFGGEKVRPLRQITPYLLSSLVLVVLCCWEDYLQIVQKNLKHQQKFWYWV